MYGGVHTRYAYALVVCMHTVFIGAWPSHETPYSCYEGDDCADAVCRSIMRHRKLEGIAFIYVSWCCVFLLHPHPSVIMSQTLHSAVARGLREAGAVLREQGAAEVSDSPLSQSGSVLLAFEEFPNSADVSK
jgi:hypothetical protein